MTYFESSIRIFDHMDLITREVFLPLLCAENSLNDLADKLMDIMHRIISQLAVAQSQIEVRSKNYLHSVNKIVNFLKLLL